MLIFKFLQYVCVPYLSRRWCTMETTRWTICILCGAALVVELPKALSTYYDHYRIQDTLSADPEAYFDACIYRRTEWVLSIGIDRFYSAYFWLVSIFVHIIPCIVLSVFSVILLRYIQRADRRRRISLLKRTIDESPGSARHCLTYCSNSNISKFVDFRILIFQH